MEKVSICVPVYNAERYLEKCLEQLVKQTYPDLEIILINDGSKDNSSEIVNRYCEEDSRIVSIEFEHNKGVSAVRNKFLEIATGKYCMFCDSDDWMELTAVETAVKKIKDSDLAIFKYNFIKPEGVFKEWRSYISEGVYSLREIEKFHTADPICIFWGVLWNKIYKLDIIKKNNMKFETTMEDVLFNLEYYNQCCTISFSNKIIYNYNQTNISMTRNVSKTADIDTGRYNGWIYDIRVYTSLKKIYGIELPRQNRQLDVWLLARHYRTTKIIQDANLVKEMNQNSVIKKISSDKITLIRAKFYVVYKDLCQAMKISIKKLLSMINKVRT